MYADFAIPSSRPCHCRVIILPLMAKLKFMCVELTTVTQSKNYHSVSEKMTALRWTATSLYQHQDNATAKLWFFHWWQHFYRCILNWRVIPLLPDTYFFFKFTSLSRTVRLKLPIEDKMESRSNWDVIGSIITLRRDLSQFKFVF